MAFFKFRKSGDEPAPAPPNPESIELMRRRAKYRLAGAAMLVLIGVIGLPILFDKQPRPIAIDTPIEIPDKNKAIMLSVPAPAATTPLVTGTSAPVAPEKADLMPVAAMADASAAVPKPESATTAASTPAVAPAPRTLPARASREGADSAKRPVKKLPAKLPTMTDDGSKALALLDGDSPDNAAPPSATRYVVQVGAFADAARAQEVRLKVEHAGLKTYTQVSATKDGQRTRVRVGPFTTKREADKASDKIKKLALPAAILKL